MHPYDNEDMVLRSQHQFLLDSEYHPHKMGMEYMVHHSQHQPPPDSESRLRKFDRQGMVLHSQCHFHLDCEFHHGMMLCKNNKNLVLGGVIQLEKLYLI